MPPKKRASKESTGAEPASKAQRQDNGEGPSTRSEPEQANESVHDGHNHASEPNGEEDPFRYMCIAMPFWNKANNDENEDGGESGHQPVGLQYHGKPASEHPDWEWIMMDETWSIIQEWHRRADYCQPDNFDMYIYNDWFGYGLQELQENLLVRFNDEFSKRQKSLEAMWALMAGMMYWQIGENGNWVGHDDGEKASKTLGLIGCAFLTMLDELDRAGHLKPDSQFRDLSPVMCLTHKWADTQDALEDEDLAWAGTVVAYAGKSGIDLESTPLRGAKELIESVDENADEDLGKAKADRWARRKQFKEFEARHGVPVRANGKPKLGGYHYDITKMSSEERAEKNFDKIDPLPKDIPEGAFLEMRRG